MKVIKQTLQEGMHFPLKRKNTRFSSAHFKPHSMLWLDQLTQELVFVISKDDLDKISIKPISRALVLGIFLEIGGELVHSRYSFNVFSDARISVSLGCCVISCRYI